jgi:hypothetical protein
MVATGSSYRQAIPVDSAPADPVRDASVMVDTKMVKTVGKHWVCATLARHNWAPALTRDGIARTDILAMGTLLPNRPTIEVQVKTASDTGSTTSWPLGGIAELVAASEHEWVVLVLLPKLPLPPRAFIVPRDHASAATWIVHQDWRTDPSVPEGKRNAAMRLARIRLGIWEGYEDRWDLLPIRTSKVPVLLPGWLRQRAQEKRVGLPTGHPWSQALPQW